MKNYNKKIIFNCLLLTCIPQSALHGELETITFISPHSQSVNAARELAGWNHKIHENEDDTLYGCFAINPEFMRSFRPDRINQCLFGNTCMDSSITLTISGSQTQRLATDWLADYFGLPTDYLSIVSMSPHIDNIIVDFNAFVGFDFFVPGLYARIHAPFVYARWDLHMRECILKRGSQGYDPGYFNATGVPRNQLVSKFTHFVDGQEVPEAAGLIFHPLFNAKMSICPLKKIGLSEIQIAVGYDIYHNPAYHMGFNIRGSIPTGNKAHGVFLFEPIIGNGRHWELGAGLTGHIRAWEHVEKNEEVNIYCDVNITHLFRNKQRRSFDLKNNSNSRYILVEKLGTPVIDNLKGIYNGVTVDPVAQFQQEVMPLANLTTFDVTISIDMQVDLAFALTYEKNSACWMVGYGLWARSCEKIHADCTPLDNNNTWALKGDAHVFGFQQNNSVPIPLSATENNATINSGTNFPDTGATTPALVQAGQQNPGIDNAMLSLADSGNTGTLEPVVIAPGSSNQINTSIQPRFVKTKDISLKSAQSRGLTQKAFAHVSHTWDDRTELIPYIGVGAEVEFGQVITPHISTDEPCDCINCAPSFWGFWIKGGFSF